MGIITQISAQKNNKNRANIFVDNKFCCGLEIIVVSGNNLKVGNSVEEEFLQTLQIESDFEKAFQKCVCILCKQQKTETQIKEYLANKGYFETVIDKVVEMLKSYNYIDDQKYVNDYVMQYKVSKSWLMIKKELHFKGIKQNLLDKVKGLCDCGELACMNSLQKYLRGKTLDKTAKDKAYRYLLSKGFDPFSIGKCISEMFDIST